MSEEKPRRRRFRFSVRTLLLLMTLVSIPFCWLGYKVRQAQQQRETVEKIGKLGGVVVYDYEPSLSYGFQHPVNPPGPQWLRSLFGVDFLADVDRVWLPFNYPVNGIVHLRSLPSLRQLTIKAVPISDSDLVHFEGLSNLEDLNLYETHVSDEGCARLQRALPKLRIFR